MKRAQKTVECGTTVRDCMFGTTLPAIPPANEHTVKAVTALAEAIIANAKAIQEVAAVMRGPAMNVDASFGAGLQIGGAMRVQGAE